MYLETKNVKKWINPKSYTLLNGWLNKTEDLTDYISVLAYICISI